jgi:ATP-dependent RNA helicase SUPV3L1/SUV3
MNISYPSAQSFFFRDRSSGVTVLLGPTNTGKTHHALDRMLCYSSGMIGLPLRLLAREVYNRAAERAGTDAVALITGEEKIKPKSARYFISTVEAMPRNLDLPFVAIDEVQLASDLDRGHIFTNRLLNCRGREETLLIGAATMASLAKRLLPGAKLRTRPRLSKLTFAGATKMTRLPRRSAIIAFSVEDVYAIAEWIRRQKGGAAVVLGALSPRTRNAQVDMFQSGEVDFIVATDAIGMGLNLDVDHIAFSAGYKFDGWQHRRLTPAEFGQIAGRAGRHSRDGTFGTTGRCEPFDAALVEALEDHRFDDVAKLQWRSSDLDFSSISGLTASLEAWPEEQGLIRAPRAIDQLVLEIAGRDANVLRTAKSRAEIARLWECCQIPDYRKLPPSAHAELVLSIFGFVARGAHIPDDWFARHVAAQDRIDGGIDILSARIAEVRTWTFIANRSGWLSDPGHWQSITRRVEDRLSDALHERLTQRFVDRRTSVLMRRLRENAMLEAEVTPSGDVLVEGQHVGQLAGFRFTPDPQASGEAARTLNAAAQKALANEIESRARRMSEAVDDAFLLANDGIIRWLGEAVGVICAGAHVLQPRVSILADQQLTGQALAMAQRRLELWLAQHVSKLLGLLSELEEGKGLVGLARGVAFQIAESLGVLDRARVAEEVKSLSQGDRAALRKLGVRFGAYHLYLPNLVKPAPRALAAQLHALKHGTGAVEGLGEVLHLAASGRTSFAANKDIPKTLYRAAGFRVCGDRAVRVDILERVADLIRPAINYRPGVTPGDPPPGAADDDGFVVTVAMTSLAGCSGDSFASILQALGYQPERRLGPAITRPSPRAAENLAEAGGGLAVDSSSAANALPQSQESPQHSEPSAAPDLPETSESTGVHQPAELHAAFPASDLSNAAAPEVEGATRDQAQEDTLHAGGEVVSGESSAVCADTSGFVEVWRLHRQHHHARKSEAHGNKRQIRNRLEAPLQPSTANAEQASGFQLAGASKEAAEMPAQHPEISKGAIDEPRCGSGLAPHGQHREAGAPRIGEPRAKTWARRHEKMPGDRERIGRADKRGDRQAEHLSQRDNKTRPGERPPDPNSPFAKLLLLKARLEEKNNSKS